MNNINYNKLYSEYGPIKVSDFISDTPETIHNKLYLNALSKFYNDYPQYKDNKNIQIIEIKPKEFWMFSKIRLIDNSTKPLKLKEFSLEEYWDNIYVKKYEDMNISKNIGDNNDKIDYYDYIHGNVTMSNKLENKHYKLNFKDIAKNTEVSESYNVYPDTFTYKKINN